MASKTIEVCDLCERAARELAIAKVSLVLDPRLPDVIQKQVLNQERLVCKRCYTRLERFVMRGLRMSQDELAAARQVTGEE